MKRKEKEKLDKVLTVIGWIVITFGVVALILFIVNSGVLRIIGRESPLL